MAILVLITHSHFVGSSPMTDTFRELLQGLPRSPDQEGFVFPEREPPVLTRAFSRLAERLGIKDLTFHDLRHDAASNMAAAGVPLRTIAEILGHRDMRMTTRYAHLSPQHLREAMPTLDAPPAARDEPERESDEAAAGRKKMRSTGTIGAPSVQAENNETRGDLHPRVSLWLAWRARRDLNSRPLD